jgi:hypothetical protein
MRDRLRQFIARPTRLEELLFWISALTIFCVLWIGMVFWG